jgi:hypothetical protein
MSECTHHWTVTSECPFCLRQEIERLRYLLQEQVSCQGQEIERLRAAHAHQYAVAGTLLREAETAQRENERLRGLLRECCEDEGSGYGISIKLLKRVREALGDE